MILNLKFIWEGRLFGFFYCIINFWCKFKQILNLDEHAYFVMQLQKAWASGQMPMARKYRSKNIKLYKCKALVEYLRMKSSWPVQVSLFDLCSHHSRFFSTPISGASSSSSEDRELLSLASSPVISNVGCGIRFAAPTPP